MSRTKIAPALRSMLDLLHPVHDEHWTSKKKCEAEFLAMAAVASAARMHSHAEVPFDPIDESKKCGICRALARLDRLSSPPSRPRKAKR